MKTTVGAERETNGEKLANKSPKEMDTIREGKGTGIGDLKVY